jgi:hypothetical protein
VNTNSKSRGMIMKDSMTMVCCPFLLFTHFFMLKGFFVFFIVSALIEIPPYPSLLDKREPDKWFPLTSED